MSAALHERAVDAQVERLLSETVALRITGPRAAGKTTSCLAVTTRMGGSAIRLDDPRMRRAVEADVVGALEGLDPPVLIDEYQRVPSVLDVVKSDVGRSARTVGRWLLCGSVSIRTTTTTFDSLGGRLHDMVMGTLTVDERNDRPISMFLSALLAHGPQPLRAWRSPAPRSRRSLLAEAVRGGFPLVTDRTSTSARRRGLEDWVRASVIADAATVGGVRDADSLRRMLSLYAAATSQIVPKDSPLADRLGIDRRTVASYRDLLAGLYAVWPLPALVPGNATGQVTRSSKLHVADSGLAAYLAGRDTTEALERDPAFTGQIVETMTVNDLRVQAETHPDGVRLHHFREDDAEVDLVAEDASGRLTGIEIKLTADPTARDLRGLRRLERSAGDRFAGGVVLCRTPIAHVTDDGIAIVPLDAVWDLTDPRPPR